MDAVNDEVQALQGIFCGQGEFEMLEHTDSMCSFCMQVRCQVAQALDQSEDSLEICIQFNLPIGYPLVLPSISLSCSDLTKNSTNQLREKLHQYAKTLEGQPMILDLVYWVKQNTWKFRTLPSSTQKKEKEDAARQKEKDLQPYVAILHIDHMRSRLRYIKTLVSWATELSIAGRLLFLHHLILVLLLGTENSVKKVDVDSNGRSCKERMMAVLMQRSHPRLSEYSDEKRVSDFQVAECSSPLDIKSIFKKADLIDVYVEAVVPKFNLLKAT
ncbi:RWD domain-containing protein 3-like isoform X2 [Asterias rubens]|uniref:RWD domain-containing protein 3-like isoform X2 n=1 Tax=Asterias rubens TaxID=7604 RepID=UPI001455AFED|nr:RWD domain-containing protein 3-like isoform X2 [Asterias rubens]